MPIGWLNVCWNIMTVWKICVAQVVFFAVKAYH